tara:strand:- start:2498 stop:2731 length:234 start_codon:yes stop_codon:yes gene_type:complete
MNDLLNILELKFQNYSNEIEYYENQLIEMNEALEMDMGSYKEKDYTRIENKIYKLEIEQGKVQDKIDNIHNKLGISY